MRRNTATQVTLCSLVAVALMAAGCGTPEGSLTEQDHIASNESRLDRYMSGIACNVTQRVSSSRGNTVTYWIYPAFGTSGCRRPSTADRIWVLMQDEGLPACSGSDCPWVEVLDPAGVVQRRYTAPVGVDQSLSIPTSAGNQYFLIRIYYPSWIISPTSLSVRFQALDW